MEGRPRWKTQGWQAFTPEPMTVKMGNPISRTEEPKLRCLGLRCDPDGFLCPLTPFALVR